MPVSVIRRNTGSVLCVCVDELFVMDARIDYYANKYTLLYELILCIV